MINLLVIKLLLLRARCEFAAASCDGGYGRNNVDTFLVGRVSGANVLSLCSIFSNSLSSVCAQM